MALRLEELAKTIDCTLLDPRAGTRGVEAVALRARDVHIASLCVLPQHVSVAAELLGGSDVKVCAVVGYPEGAAAAKAKLAEAERCLEEGAGELELALNVRAMLLCDFALVRDELTAFVRAMRMRGANGGRGAVVLKAVIGTGRLDDKRKKLACKLVELAEVDFAQTAVNGAPVTIQDVELLRDFLPEGVGVKASGGVETLDDVLAMINAGAGRIGSTAALEILAAAASLDRVPS
ncbi:MAG TPA: deoxyribose-phosphate aldolase [Gaiellaceae bacterium]|jgi:deoxyribose-phosphate aldolase